MIPAFLAAYSGKSPNDIKLSPFPKNPIPNWNVNYAGLTKLPFISDIFSSINLTHAYSSVYDVSNYTNSLLYNENQVGLNNELEDYPRATQKNAAGEMVPVYVIDQVIIAERFAPLIGINVKTKGRLTARLEYRTERNLALNLSNAQLTELNRKDLVFEFGFIKAGIKIPFRIGGETKTLENDLNFKLSIGIGDSKTIQRKIDEESTITSGNLTFQLRPTINYIVNERLSLNFYFERNINEPRVTSAFKRTTTAFGTQVRFSLTQ
jgi:cell surface protein SprA